MNDQTRPTSAGNSVRVDLQLIADMIEPGGNIEYTQDSFDIVQLLGRFIFSVEKAGGEPK